MITSFSGAYAFLSNFYPCEVMLDGEWYKSVEHAYQAAKTLNLEERRRIASMPTPGKAKRAGRAVKLRENWEQIKCQVMLQLLRQKFSDARLKELLLDTKDAELIEVNNHKDNYWGVQSESEQGVQSDGADAKPSDLPMARLKSP